MTTSPEASAGTPTPIPPPAAEVLSYLDTLGLPITDRTVTSIAVDQTNRSFIVGRQYVVKIRPEEIADDDVALVRLRLLNAAGFDSAPRFWGANGPALVTSYLPDAVDGWTWCVGECRSALRVDEVDIIGAPAGTTPTIGGWPAALGDLTARMHVALLDHDRGLVAGHGDLHVGQILRTPDGALWVSDFDGNPTLTPAQRQSLRPATYDVAGMLLSLENVGHVVRKWSTEAGCDLAQSEVAAWTDGVQRQFLDAYRAAAALARGGGILTGQLDAAAMEREQVEQIWRELAYADRFLPRWRYVPEAALRRRGML